MAHGPVQGRTMGLKRLGDTTAPTVGPEIGGTAQTQEQIAINLLSGCLISLQILAWPDPFQEPIETGYGCEQDLSLAAGLSSIGQDNEPHIEHGLVLEPTRYEAVRAFQVLRAIGRSGAAINGSELHNQFSGTPKYTPGLSILVFGLSGHSSITTFLNSP